MLPDVGYNSLKGRLAWERSSNFAEQLEVAPDKAVWGFRLAHGSLLAGCLQEKERERKGKVHITHQAVEEPSFANEAESDVDRRCRYK